MSEAITCDPLVREINVPGHQIKIRFRCWYCGRIKGRVFKNGREDKEDVYYRSSFILFLPGDEENIPTSLCSSCNR